MNALLPKNSLYLTIYRVGDSIQISNPNHDEELYTLTVVGIYSDSSANESSFSMFGATSTDPANRIYVSYATLQEIIEASEAAVAELTDEDSSVAALSGTLEGTYVLQMWMLTRPLKQRLENSVWRIRIRCHPLI